MVEQQPAERVDPGGARQAAGADGTLLKQKQVGQYLSPQARSAATFTTLVSTTLGNNVLETTRVYWNNLWSLPQRCFGEICSQADSRLCPPCKLAIWEALPLFYVRVQFGRCWGEFFHAVQRALHLSTWPVSAGVGRLRLRDR